MLVRVVPFFIFLGLTFLQDPLGEGARYWIYFLKTIAGAAMLLFIFRYIAEFEWRFSWEALIIGIGVFAVWVGLDGHYPSLDGLYREYVCPVLEKLGLVKSCAVETAAAPKPWNPNIVFGVSSPLAIFFILVRILGSTLVVPPLEEMFYRSFVYRFLAHKDFLSVPFGKFAFGPFIITSLVFGFAHHEWLPGILCGFAYQGLVIWKNRLGDAVTAHAITNFLLGLWVVGKGAWHFW